MSKSLSLIILVSLIAILIPTIAKAQHNISLDYVSIGGRLEQVEGYVKLSIHVRNLDLSRGYNYYFTVHVHNDSLLSEYGYVKAGGLSYHTLIFPSYAIRVWNYTADIYLYDEFGVADHMVTNEFTIRRSTLRESVDHLEDDALELQQNMSDFRFDMADTLNEVDSLRSSINDLQLMNKNLLAVSIITLIIAVVAVSVPILTHIRKRDRELMRLEES